jgi:WD40 repeat protein
MTRIIERKDGAALDRAGRARVATAWRPLHHWLAENDSDRAIRGRLHDAADELMYNDHDSSDLYHGSLLDFAAETVDRLTGDPTQHPLSRSDQDFMDESLRARHQAALRSRTSTLSLIVLVLAAGLVAVLLFRANQDVNQRGEITVERQLTSENEDLGELARPTPGLKNLAARSSHPSANARYSMVGAGSRAEVARVTGHMVDVFSVMFSPDGMTLASGSGDGSVRLWDVATQRIVGSPLTGRTDGVNSVAFSPDGQTLASGSGDDSIRLWDVVAQRLAGSPLTGHTEVVASVAFSPDGKILASGSFDGSVRL